MINDLKSSIESISESTINRRIRKLKKLGIIRTRIDQKDERIVILRQTISMMITLIK